MTPRRRDGVALVLVAGTLVLLAALAAAFAAGTRMTARVGRATAPDTRLAAESGLAYAAARLVDASYPRYPRTPENRGDDWSYRDAPEIPLARAQNPSYAHGQGASGRLRGTKETRFSLRIVSTGAKIPVNAFPGSYPGMQTPIRGLAHAINNLGAIILPAGHPRRREIQMTGTTIPYSRLGDDLLSNRPFSGYAGWADLAGRLAGLGGGLWYAPAEIDLLARFVTTTPPITTPQAGPAGLLPITSLWRPGTPLELATVSPETLSALVRLAGTNSVGGRLTAYWEAASLYAAVDPRTGETFGNSPPVLFPDEADALAEFVTDLRETAPAEALSWNLLRQRLADSAGSLFSVAPPDPIARAGYRLAKGDLAFAAISPDPNPCPVAAPPAWASWGIARPVGPAGAFWPPCLDGLGFRRLYPTQTGFTTEGAVPLGLTTRPPRRFEIDCAALSDAGAVSVSSALDTGIRTLTLSSQADLENPDSVGTELRAIGIRESLNDAVWGDPSYTGRREQETDPDLGWATHRLVSLPDCGPGHGMNPVNTATFPFGRKAGALALAPRQAGARDADLYWPFAEAAATADRIHLSRPGVAGTVLSWGGAEYTPDPSEEDPFPAPTRDFLSGHTHFPFGERPLCSPFFISGSGEGSPSHGPTLVVGAAETPGVVFPGIRPNQIISYVAVEFWTRSATPDYLNDATDHVMKLDWSPPVGSPRHVTLKATEYFTDLALSQSGQIGTEWHLFHPYSYIGSDGLNHGGQISARINRIDAAGAPRVHFVRIVLRSERVVTPFGSYDQTTLALQVDGETASGTAADYRPRGLDPVRLSARCVSDLRIYGAQRAGEGTARDRGRFVRSGRYISPLYTFESPVRLVAAQWTGITPSGWLEEEAIRVMAVADSAPGSASGDTVPLPDESGEIAFPSRDPVWTLRYLVDLAVPPSIPDAAALDTPVFEGIWFAFRPVGGRVGWADWTSR